MEIGPVRLSDYTTQAVQAPAQLQQNNDRRELIQAVKAVNKAEMFGQDNEVTFGADPNTRKPIVKLVNRKTKEVIRQIPPEYLLNFARNFEAK